MIYYLSDVNDKAFEMIFETGVLSVMANRKSARTEGRSD
jgi:hypothetical protein